MAAISLFFCATVMDIFWEKRELPLNPLIRDMDSSFLFPPCICCCCCGSDSDDDDDDDDDGADTPGGVFCGASDDDGADTPEGATAACREDSLLALSEAFSSSLYLISDDIENFDPK